MARTFWLAAAVLVVAAAGCSVERVQVQVERGALGAVRVEIDAHNCRFEGVKTGHFR